MMKNFYFISSKLLVSVLLLSSVILVKAQKKTLFLDKIDYTTDTVVSISMKTKNFNNIEAVNGTINWDSTVLKYKSITYGTSGVLLNASSMNLLKTKSGILAFSWNDGTLVGQTVIDSTKIFSLTFSILKQTVQPTSIFFNDAIVPREIDTVDVNSIPTALDTLTQSAFENGYVSFALKPFIIDSNGVLYDSLGLAGLRVTGTTYQWFLNGVAIQGANADSLHITAPGTYTLNVTYPNGASSTPTVVSAIFTVLPIKLEKFEGYNSNNTNYLNWTSLSEINTNYFEIQKSSRGNEFNSIGQVRANGNSTSTINYSFNDKIESNNLVQYYRLKIVDVNGSFSYSNIVKIAKSTKTAFNVLENPAHNTLKIAGTDIKNVRLFDNNGKLVLAQSFSNNKNVQLNISQIPVGAYFISIANINGLTETKSVIIK